MSSRKVFETQRLWTEKEILNEIRCNIDEPSAGPGGFRRRFSAIPGERGIGGRWLF